jgi:hypothetical protein
LRFRAETNDPTSRLTRMKLVIVRSTSDDTNSEWIEDRRGFGG